MYKDLRVVVVVPAFNEARLLPRVLETMPNCVDQIVVVDDYSGDDTAEIVTKAIEAGDARLVLCSHASNRGVGAAIATGYLCARDAGCDIAVVMAGDAQMDPADLPKLLQPIAEKRADYAKGNRLADPLALSQIPKLRLIGIYVLTFLSRITSGYWHLTDFQSGYTAISRRALGAIDWEQMYPRYGQPNDLLISLAIAGFRVVDVPIRPVYNIGEVSGIKVGNVVFTIGWLLLRRFADRLMHYYRTGTNRLLCLGYALFTVSMVISAVALCCEATRILLLSLAATLLCLGIAVQADRHRNRVLHQEA